jgi:NAD(P)H-flavin reductase
MSMQRDRLFLALTAIVRSVDSPDALSGYLDRLGRGHRRFGVLREHYGAMRSALIATLRRFAGPHWTAETEAAWIAAFDVAAKMMVRAADADALTSPPWWIAEVTRHELRAPDIAVLTLRPNLPLPFSAGQHLPVQTARWPRVWRPYSIANAPRADGTVRLHVRAVPGGWVSGALVRSTRIGDAVLLGAAAGGMTVDPTADRELLLIAGGTGLAPLKAIAEQIAAAGGTRTTHLVFGARSEHELYDLPSLRRMAGAHPWLTVTPVVSDDPAFTGVRGTPGSLLAGDTGEPGAPRPVLTDPANCDAYVCGPAEMVRDTVTRLRRQGVPTDRIHREAVDPAAQETIHDPARPTAPAGLGRAPSAAHSASHASGVS